MRSRALLTVLIAWNVAMFSSAAVNVAEPRLAIGTFSAGRFGLGLMMGCAGVGLALGAYLAGALIERRGLSNVYGVSLGLMALGLGVAAGAPNVWVAAVCVVVSGCGNGAAVVCNALLVQRGAPDALRGRVFAVLMSSNVALLVLGMVVAGWLTDVVGPRWVWAAAAVAAGLAGIVGFALLRGVGVGEQPPQLKPEPALTSIRVWPRAATSPASPLRPAFAPATSGRSRGRSRSSRAPTRSRTTSSTTSTRRRAAPTLSASQARPASASRR